MFACRSLLTRTVEGICLCRIARWWRRTHHSLLGNVCHHIKKLCLISKCIELFWESHLRQAKFLNHWRIQDFPDREGRKSTPEFGAKAYYLTRFLSKTAWNWKKLGSLVPPTHFGSANVNSNQNYRPCRRSKLYFSYWFKFSIHRMSLLLTIHNFPD